MIQFTEIMASQYHASVLSVPLFISNDAFDASYIY